ncbi:MAG: DNA mismatch repair protein [Chitinophagaceae bacterium]|nr:DNA mismatch repair protein [Chitinophagaceae bacterium]
MSFITDKQTLADLNLLGKFKTGSLFNLFNQVRTRGGELLLEQMFLHPLSSAAEINLRSGQLRYLQDLDLELKIDGEMTEMAAHYLAEPKPSNYLASIFACYKEKSQELLYRSEKFHIQQRHMYAVQELLLSASDLLGKLLKKEKKDNPCKELQDQLSAIIQQPAIKQLKAKYPYTVKQAAECKYLFLNKCRQDLEELLRIIYRFDVYLSVARVAAEKKMVFATATDAPQHNMMEVRNLRHPSLSHATGNHLQLSKDNNLLFLTGANMAGKSTWMKSLGVSFYLAHMGFPVAADSMRFTVMDGIFTSINVPDDISLGWSHFYAEVMRVKVVAQEVSSGKRLFILFDELFKGTNVKDAYDATLSVTKKLALYRSCAFVISTHIIEVGTELTGTAHIQFGYMPTVMKDGKPSYTYLMTEGITTDRQGMIIIENEKILEMLA